MRGTNVVVVASVSVLVWVLSACAAPVAAGGVDDGLDTTSAADTAGADGAPVRKPCTSSFGTGLGGQFGRLDGTIIAIVPPGRGACNADRDHVHVQVLAGGDVYDIAVNTNGGFMADREAPLPGGSWSEGWHRGGALDYARDLGLHAGDFQSLSDAQLASKLETALASANHVSAFATIYSHGGAHLVHRRGSNLDGAIVLDPLASKAHVYAFRFGTQTF